MLYEKLSRHEYSIVVELLERMVDNTILTKLDQEESEFPTINDATIFQVHDLEKFAEQKDMLEITNTGIEKSGIKIVDTTKNETVKKPKEVSKQKGVEPKMQNNSQDKSPEMKLIEKLSMGPLNGFFRQIRKLFVIASFICKTLDTITDRLIKLEEKEKEQEKFNRQLREILQLPEKPEKAKYKKYGIDKIADAITKKLGITMDTNALSDDETNQQTKSKQEKDELYENIMTLIRKKKEA